MTDAGCPTSHGDPRTFGRRKALTLLGMAGVALVPGCASGRSGAEKSTSGSTSTTAAASAGGASTSAPSSTAACVLARESTEGPFYLDLDNVRSDITEGRPGVPLELAITVVAADGCAPMKDAAVDIWHTDAAGAYSGVGAAGRGGSGGGTQPSTTDSQTFMRGTQVSDVNGLVTFRTVYPGWYTGRAVHIHTKVHAPGPQGAGGTQTGTAVHTGQLFFDDGLTDTVYKAAPYNSRPGRDQRNADDGIFRSAGADSAVLDVVPQGTGYVAKIVLGVKQAGSVNRA